MPAAFGVRRALLCLFLVGAVALVARLPIAAADDTYAIKLKLTAGQKWAFDVTSSMKQKGSVSANGQVAQDIDQGFETRRKGTLEVLQVSGGLPTQIRVSYDGDSFSSGKITGQPMPAFALAGKTVTISKGDNGDIQYGADAPNLDDATKRELAQLLEPDRIMYPRQPVSVNQEWDGDTAPLVKQFQLSPDDKATVRCKLRSVAADQGRSIADVSITADILKHDQGFIETRTALTGSTQIDLQTGQPLVADMRGKMTTTGQKQVNGADGNPVAIAVAADGDIQVHQVVRFLNTPDANAPDALQGGFNPPAPPMARPAVPPANAPTFAGAFKSDALTLDLTPDGDQYTGSLTIRDKKLPVQAKANGDQLTGSFESEGAKFNFTATLANGTLTLTSDNNTYTLKKVVSNPLAQPTRNPLAQ